MRALAPALIELQRRWCAHVHFHLVYLAEAHAQNQWPIGSHIKISAHRTLDDRRAAAQQLVQELAWSVDAIPVWCDNMHDTFLETLAAWPLRFYIVHEQRFRYIAEPIVASYSMHELEKAIEAVVSKV